MDTAFFSGIRIQPVQLSTGARMGLPVRFYDWSSIMAHFPASAAAVQKLLPTGKLKPALLKPGAAIVTLAAIEYRSIADIEPYNEFGIMIPALYQPGINPPALPLLFPGWFSRFGMYFHRLPVTTQAAVDYGVELWGYPKFIAEISFEDTPNSRRCRLCVAGKVALTLEVDKMAVKNRPMTFYTYTVKDGRLLRTRLQIQGEYGVARLSGSATYTLGEGPLADELRSLGMSQKAVERFYAPRLQSLIFPAEQYLPL